MIIHIGTNNGKFGSMSNQLSAKIDNMLSEAPQEQVDET